MMLPLVWALVASVFVRTLLVWLAGLSSSGWLVELVSGLVAYSVGVLAGVGRNRGHYFGDAERRGSPRIAELDSGGDVGPVLEPLPRLALVVAHPDDEAMFFGPFLRAAAAVAPESVHVLCLSTGDFDGMCVLPLNPHIFLSILAPPCPSNL